MGPYSSLAGLAMMLPNFIDVIFSAKVTLLYASSHDFPSGSIFLSKFVILTFATSALTQFFSNGGSASCFIWYISCPRTPLYYRVKCTRYCTRCPVFYRLCVYKI